MNKTQLGLAIESIRGDCDTTGTFKNKKGQTCAVGGLAGSLSRQGKSAYVCLNYVTA